jgi:hypothetical protein
VDTLPCLGAISISLMDTPFVDLTLKLINNWDLMSLPFVHDLVLQGVKIGADPVRAGRFGDICACLSLKFYFALENQPQAAATIAHPSVGHTVELMR